MLEYNDEQCSCSGRSNTGRLHELSSSEFGASSRSTFRCGRTARCKPTDDCTDFRSASSCLPEHLTRRAKRKVARKQANAAEEYIQFIHTSYRCNTPSLFASAILKISSSADWSTKRPTCPAVIYPGQRGVAVQRAARRAISSLRDSMTYHVPDADVSVLQSQIM